MTKANDFKGFLNGKLISLSKMEELDRLVTKEDLLFVFRELIEKYDQFEKKGKVTVYLANWKGQDKPKFIEKPDRFIIITHSKADQDSNPKEHTQEVSKEEINTVIKAVYYSNKKVDKDDNAYIETKEIARQYCIIRGITFTRHGNRLFEKNGEFNWNFYFADRKAHERLNIILRLLDFYKVIRYRSGKTYILNNNFKFQLNL